MTLGRVLALDHGSRRIGVAVSDPQRLVASPLRVIEAEGALAEIEALADEYDPDVIVIGLPVGLSGREGPAAAAAREFAARVASATGRPVELVDERFTTHAAERSLLEGGLKRRDRRHKVDKVAAALILQHYLERPP